MDCKPKGVLSDKPVIALVSKAVPPFSAFSQAELMTVGARIDKIHNSETPNPIKPDEEVISGMITEEDLEKALMFGEDAGFEALVRIATMVGENKTRTVGRREHERKRGCQVEAESRCRRRT